MLVPLLLGLCRWRWWFWYYWRLLRGFIRALDDKPY